MNKAHNSHIPQVFTKTTTRIICLVHTEGARDRCITTSSRENLTLHPLIPTAKEISSHCRGICHHLPTPKNMNLRLLRHPHLQFRRSSSVVRRAGDHLASPLRPHRGDRIIGRSPRFLACDRGAAAAAMPPGRATELRDAPCSAPGNRPGSPGASLSLFPVSLARVASSLSFTNVVPKARLSHPPPSCACGDRAGEPVPAGEPPKQPFEPRRQQPAERWLGRHRSGSSFLLSPPLLSLQ